MKKTKIISFIIAIGLVLGFVSVGLGKYGAKNSKNTAYNFPVKTGTDEWKKFNSHDEMVNATQIPANVIDSMTTRALYLSCLDYPLFGDMFAFNSLNQGFENFYNNFNGLREFLGRPDASDVVLQEYQATDLNSYSSHYRNWEKDLFDEKTKVSANKDAMFFSSIVFLEILIAQPEIYNVSSSTEDIFLKKVEKNLKQKNQLFDVYGGNSQDSATLAIENILKAKGLLKEEEKVTEQKSLENSSKQPFNDYMTWLMKKTDNYLGN